MKIEKPEIGYYIFESVDGAREPRFVDEDNAAKAIADGQSITYFAEMADGVHSLDFYWGMQPAEAFLLVKDGKKIDFIRGAGDQAPYLTRPAEECLAAGQLFTSDEISDKAEENAQYEREFWAAADRLGLAAEYRRLKAALDDEARITSIERQIEAEAEICK